MNRWHLEFGANYLPNGNVQFRVCAPKAQTLSIVFHPSKSEYPMIASAKGMFELTLSASLCNEEYFYLVNNKLCPDPVSRWQPLGVHGPTRIYDPDAFLWTDQQWKGIPLKEYIIYELHIGVFSPTGTFEAIIDKLPYLKELGVTAIELMPVTEFPGERNWGYDGTCLYAPHHSYGGPEKLKRLINAAHEAGLAVILDVVYNHLGPEGNYLQQFGYYFTDRYKTPWGDAINYDGPEGENVRRYVVDNTLYWLTEYHVDALRVDAIHAIFDFSSHHILEEIQESFHAQSTRLGRKAFIIAESNLNDIRTIKPMQEGGYGLDAQWNDEFHHALHEVVYKTQWEYLADFGKMSQLAKAITEGFVYDGNQPSTYRKKTFGTSAKNFPGERFVIFIQNHDQIGNAGQGMRLGHFVSQEKYILASIILLCSPNLPLIFMGQEWNATTPFYFFTSYEDPDLGKNVREGYQREFNLKNEDLFDPQNIERFQKSKLQWKERESLPHLNMLKLYKKLIQLRKKYLCLSNCRKDLTEVSFNEDEKWLILYRSDPDNSKMVLIANFNDKAREVLVKFPAGHWQLQLGPSNATETEFSTNQSILKNLHIPPWTAILYLSK